jgi:hypothetical protein
MTETRPKIPTSLTEAQIFRLFKCAVKDDVTLIDAIIEYGTCLQYKPDEPVSESSYPDRVGNSSEK